MSRVLLRIGLSMGRHVCADILSDVFPELRNMVFSPSPIYAKPQETDNLRLCALLMESRERDGTALSADFFP
jgi:hypothetical protein